MRRSSGWPTAVLCAGLLCTAGAGSAQEASPKAGLVARVNGVELTETEYYRRCAETVGGKADTAVGFLVVREWIEQTLLEADARAKNLLPTEDQVDRRVRALRRQFEFRGQDFVEWLSTHGRSMRMLREEVRHQLIAENVLTEGVTVSDTEAALYYQGNKQVFGTPEQLKVSRITLKERAAVKQVESALKQGRAFEQVAREQSVDPYARQGGALPAPITPHPKDEGPMEPDVMRRLRQLKAGEWYGPVKHEDYWVFVRLEERIPERIPPLADVQELLVANLKVQKAGPERLQTAQKRLQQLHQEAKVEVFRPEHQPLLKMLKKAE